MSVYDLPLVNASLNSLSTLFICFGWWFIRREMKLQHIVCMVAALVTSTAFLACYLYYHHIVGSIKFTHQGIVRPVYYFILLTHVLLAFAVPPLAIVTVVPAVRARWDKHRKVGKWTMPIWLYVSITGVLVYLMLYQWFPSSEIRGNAP